MFGRGLVALVVTTALALAASFWVEGPWRMGALVGVAGAAFSSAVAFGLLKLSYERGPQKILAALVAGFLLRMLVVAAALLIAHGSGWELLAAAIGFLSLYLVHQLIEIAVVARRQRPAEVKA